MTERVEYPEAGIGFADVEEIGSLADIMEKTLENKTIPDRCNIQKLFEGKSVVSAFVSAIEQKLKTR